MSELLCIARLKIHDGKLDEFMNLAARSVELLCTKDRDFAVRALLSELERCFPLIIATGALIFSPLLGEAQSTTSPLQGLTVTS